LTDRAPSRAEEALTVAEARKVDAEIEKLKAETAALHFNDLKNAAEIAKIEAETRDSVAKALTSEEMLIVNRLMREAKEREARVILSSNEYYRIYNFSGIVSDKSAAACMFQLQEWHRLWPGADMEIVFTSPGGSIIDGMALYDFIQQIRRQGHKVTTSTIGYAASMAGILLQAGDVRVMGKEAWLMIHEASFGAQGKTGEIEDTVEWVKKVQERIVDIFSSRSNMTKAQIRNKWTRRDWWISSNEALELGLIDEVR
jgi:ATP-dependent Clp protease protease subunit